MDRLVLVARNSKRIHGFSYHFWGTLCYSCDFFIEKLVLVARNSKGIHILSYHFWGTPCYSWDFFIERLVLVARNSKGIHSFRYDFGVQLAIAGMSCWQLGILRESIVLGTILGVNLAIAGIFHGQARVGS